MAAVAAFAAPADSLPPPLELTAEQDHRMMMEQLGITSIRQGADGRDPKAPSMTNYDESKGQPVSGIARRPQTRQWQPVRNAQQWWKQRRPQIVEHFDREVYGRLPMRVRLRASCRGALRPLRALAAGAGGDGGGRSGAGAAPTGPSVWSLVDRPSHAVGRVSDVSALAITGWTAPDRFDRLDAADRAVVGPALAASRECGLLRPGGRGVGGTRAGGRSGPSLLVRGHDPPLATVYERGALCRRAVGRPGHDERVVGRALH